MSKWTPPDDLPWPELQVADPVSFSLKDGETIRSLYVQALLQDPGVRHSEGRALLVRAVLCPWADVWVRAFSELWHPTDAGAMHFLEGFVRLCEQFEAGR